MIETLCWNCSNAYGQCSWSKDFTPVEGWNAERKDVKVTVQGYVPSYIVFECPLYEGDTDEID